MTNDSFELNATLVPGSDTAALLRVISILHGRGTLVRELTFRSSDLEGASVTAHVTTRNAGRAHVEASLQRMVEVDRVVTTRAEPPLGLVRHNG